MQLPKENESLLQQQAESFNPKFVNYRKVLRLEIGPAPRNTLEQRLAGKIAKRIAKARERREDAELNRAMRELSLDDHDDPMDTSNAIRGVPIELVQGENGEIMLVQKKR
ncbi:hypothetical protein RclHR1_07310012 [Rhizophagus clarus]|uniref:Uncharacterized protein n=1 Tax=Rhizophagus clarus TaxID=94130 RepID=A0A2Z6SBU5_9GLOM|nr:hypothetical protein RclHR1_07310012 [Rhizophagus clarus]